MIGPALYRKRLKQWLALVLALAALALSGCRGEAEKAVPEMKRPVRLAENPWLASRLNAAVAKILITEELGHPVEIVPVDETAQFERLASGDLHATLEVWPSGRAGELARYAGPDKPLEDGGPLGAVGKIGWYLPAHMLKEHPELVSWQGLLDDGNGLLFKTGEDDATGRFLAGDPSWVQYDAQIIRNLGLPLRVEFAGSEKELLAALDAAYRERKPILFYFWTPHAAFAKYNLAEMRLPPYSRECYDKSGRGGVDCGYPPDVLRKVFWSGLAGYAPDVRSFLKNFRLSNEDQITMMGLVEIQGKTVEEAARWWVGQNSDVWKPWLP